MRCELRLVPRAVGQLLLATALTAVAAMPVRAQSGVTESWRDSAGNWSGKRHALDPDGNLLVLGDTVVGDIIQVRKLSPAGALLWSSIYAPPERVVSYWIASDPAGNAWVAAARITGSQNSRVGFVVLKYDPDGNLVFTDITPGGMALRVVTDAAANAYVVGNGWFTGAADAYMVVKYAPDGTRLWTGVLESGSTSFLARADVVALSPDQTRLLVAGGGSSLTFRGFSVALFDTSDGRRLWNHVDSARYGAVDGAFAPDGTSVFVGNTDITVNPTAMALHKYDLAGNLLFRRTYPQGIALIRLAVDRSSNVVATGTALPLPGSAYRDWMTIKTDPAGTLLWARRYDATTTNDEVPQWVTVDDADAVYVAGMGGPSPTTGNVSFLKPVNQKYDAAGNPIWTILDGGDAQVTVDAAGSVFTLATGQMTSARFEQTGTSPPPALPSAPANLVASSNVRRAISLAWTNTTTIATAITVERCTGSTCTDFAPVAQLAASATTWTDTGLRSRVTYRYRLFASNAAGRSPYSNIASARAR